MTNFIAQTLNTSPVIVAGYSGFNDGFFEQINKHYCGEQRLFWIGYEKEVPEHLQNFFKKYKNHAHYIGGQDADDFFISLMQHLDCLPDFFTNHAQHTIRVLDEVIDFPMPNTDDGINIMSDLRQQMVELGKQILSLTAILNNLMMEGKNNEVIELIETQYGQISDEVDITAIDEEIKYMYVWAQINAAKKDWIEIKRKRFNEDNDEAIKSVFKRFESSEILRPKMHEIYLGWGYILSELAYITNDIDTYNTSIKKFSKVSELDSSVLEHSQSWGTALLMLAELTKDPYYNSQALEKLKVAETIQPTNVYNLACAHVRLGQADKAKKKLVICKENNTLPPKELLLNDSDMRLFYDTPWFEDLIVNLE